MGDTPVDSDLILSSVASTARRTISPGLAGVGLRTHALRLDNLSSDRFPRPAEEFLLASRLRRCDRETLLSIASYGADCEVVTRSRIDREPEAGADLLPLAPSSPLEAGLTAAVASRRSVRTWSGEPVRQEELAAVVRHAASVTAEGVADLMTGGTVPVALRAAPSAGGLYPVQLWVAVRRVAGMDPGVLRYLPDRDALARHAGPEAVDTLLASFDVQDGTVELDRAAAVLLLVARPWRAMRKYGPRGMRFVFHEAGAIAQNAHLAVTALGLGAVDFSGFYDDESNNALDIDGVYECLVHTVIVGTPR
ncbi:MULTISPECIES: SagB/ThcOx family dehydrogenase [unclassified Streptomyces]|uniref:SagB/ThcOx family dehydrogenase n=1 Tax=unclassified Streptomyces TaxID=2593676 RepID=UPI00068958AA|nr:MULTISPECIES: SagB/ThcOx family dehydrogenase [unclassified Streptomyces]MCH0555574.1 SagB/ThcOx family dehydrogenase [Streptomyces sp. MUM 16J]